MTHGNRKHRPSSYHMNDPEVVFDALGLEEGASFLDVGCGAGDYSVRAAGIVGDGGRVYALDSDAETIEYLKGRVISERIGNVDVMRADVTERLPLADGTIDVCLLSTVLHIPRVKEGGDSLFREIYRVLKDGGRLFVIECGDKDLSRGPPASMRVSSREVEAMVAKHGYEKTQAIDLGFNYLIGFRKRLP